MTDSENSVVQNDSDEDIYKDFADFDFGDELHKIECSKEIYKKEANDLSEKVKALDEENQKLKNLNKVLEKNLSTLLKTAQAEVKRKDSVIAELREQIESFTFKRSNKVTKDKYTNTEINWDSEVDSKMGVKDCKNGRESKKGQSEKGRNSLDKDRKTLRYESKNVTGKNSRERSSDYDNKKKFSDGHSYSSRRDRSDSFKSYRQDYRENSKYFDIRRKLNSYHRSSPERNFRERYSREKHYDRHGRSESNKMKSTSRSPRRSRNSKESLIEKHRSSRSSFEKEFKKRNRDRASNQVKCSETVKKRSEFSKIHEKEKDEVKNRKISENHLNKKCAPTDEIVKFDRKSPLDALYGEYLSSKNCVSILKPASDPGQKQPELVEVKNREGEYSNAERDERLICKKEARNVSEPVTLFSKRMMKRFSMESKEAESKNVKCENILNDSAAEKEPGELTDDESEVERSEEFQRVAKAAFFENKMMDDELTMTAEGGVANIKDETSKERGDNCKNLIESQTLLAGSEPSCLDQNIDDVKKFREVIEFSPFKNNYKLIEISPAKASDKIRGLVESSNGKQITSNSGESSKVETSILNFLSHLSGIPVNARNLQKGTEKTGNKVSVCEVTQFNDGENSEVKSDVGKCEMNEGKRTGGKGESEKLIEGDKNLSTSCGRNSKQKTDTLKAIPSSDQKEKKVEKKLNHSKSQSKEDGKENDGAQKDVEEKIIGEKNEQVKNEIKPGEKEKNNFETDSEKNGKYTDFKLLDLSPSSGSGRSKKEEKLLLESTAEKNKIDSSVEKTKSAEEKNATKRDEFETQEVSMKSKKISKNSDSKSRKNVALKESQKLKRTPEKIEKTENECPESKKKKDKSSKSEESNKTKEKPEENVPGRGKRKFSSKTGENQRKPMSKTNESKTLSTDKSRKRKLSECKIVESKKSKIGKSERTKKKSMNSSGSSNEEQDSISEEQKKVKEDISAFEFFKPITKKEETSEKHPGSKEQKSNSSEFKMAAATTTTTTTMTVTGVMRLQTPIKRVEKLKKLTINEQTIHHVSNSKIGSPFSPFAIGEKLVEMTPRRLLKNDLMLTDSEDDLAAIKPGWEGGEMGGEKAEDYSDSSRSETSDCESDSGASDFVDLL